ncbi:hypothetical protein [Nonomuraea jiangxiensis]|nr:hypothetical protein [Nonomuraea jiangxiensis]
MRRRLPVWAGRAVAVAAATGLALYLVRVGLDDADKLASVIGLFIALAGLATAGYGLAPFPSARARTGSPAGAAPG